jgi:hypothetical protein
LRSVKTVPGRRLHDVPVKHFPAHPAQPHRICWGCDLYCAAHEMRCGNGSVRTPHPVELFGDDWDQWGVPASAPAPDPAPGPATGRQGGG